MTHWKEALDVERHQDHVSGAQCGGGSPIKLATSDGWVYFVRACSFTFTFATLNQLREALAYFGQILHPARRRPGITLEHYWHRWYERLPPGLIGGSKRLRIRRALAQALASFTSTQTKTARERPAHVPSSLTDVDLVGKRVAVAGVLPPSADPTGVLSSLWRFVEQQGGVAGGAVLQRRGVSRSRRPGGTLDARAAIALHPSTYLGAGKTRELARLCQAQKIEVIVFLNPLRGGQAARIEALTGAIVVQHESSALVNQAQIL